MPDFVCVSLIRISVFTIPGSSAKDDETNGTCATIWWDWPTKQCGLLIHRFLIFLFRKSLLCTCIWYVIFDWWQCICVVWMPAKYERCAWHVKGVYLILYSWRKWTKERYNRKIHVIYVNIKKNYAAGNNFYEYYIYVKSSITYAISRWYNPHSRYPWLHYIGTSLNFLVPTMVV